MFVLKGMSVYNGENYDEPTVGYHRVPHFQTNPDNYMGLCHTIYFYWSEFAGCCKPVGKTLLEVA